MIPKLRYSVIRFLPASIDHWQHCNIHLLKDNEFYTILNLGLSSNGQVKVLSHDKFCICTNFFFHAVNFTYLYLIIAWGTEHWVVTYEGKLRYSKSVRSGLAPWTNNVAKHCKWWYVAVIVIGNPGKPIKCYRIGS